MIRGIIMSYIGDWYYFFDWLKEQFQYMVNLQLANLLGVYWVQLKLLEMEEQPSVAFTMEGLELEDDEECVFTLDFELNENELDN